MSKNNRRAKASKRFTTKEPARSGALCWPEVLRKFADWLIETNCAADSFVAYWTAMAVDRSARERNIVVVGAEFPLELFAVEDYLSYFVDECDHLPWTHDDFVDALGLFANFVVAERISQTQADIFAQDIIPLGPRQAPMSARLSTPIGPMALTAQLQQVACWCEDNGSVPGSCLAHPSASVPIRRKLSREPGGGEDAVKELLSIVTYRAVIATALGIEMLDGSGHSLKSGAEFESWLGAPSQAQLHRMLVEAYSVCLEPVVDFEDAAVKEEVCAAVAGLWFTLVRSVADDPVRQGEVLSTGTGTDSINVSAWMTVRFATMLDLGLIVSVNGQFCIPDTHRPALLDALDRHRTRRAGMAA